jgi:hypothetical protein
VSIVSTCTAAGGAGKCPEGIAEFERLRGGGKGIDCGHEVRRAHHF